MKVRILSGLHFGYLIIMSVAFILSPKIVKIFVKSIVLGFFYAMRDSLAHVVGFQGGEAEISFRNELVWCGNLFAGCGNFFCNDSRVI